MMGGILVFTWLLPISFVCGPKMFCFVLLGSESLLPKLIYASASFISISFLALRTSRTLCVCVCVCVGGWGGGGGGGGGPLRSARIFKSDPKIQGKNPFPG